jgi:hypothetical protein
MSTARSPGGWDVTYNEVGGTTGTRLFMVDGGDVDIFLGRSPAPSRMNNSELGLYAFWRPTLMARRQGPAGLDSLFAGVIEPFEGKSSIAAVKRLPISVPGQDQIALRVTFADGREDTILVDLAAVKGASSPGSFATADGQYTLAGRIGISSRRGGTERGTLVAGSRFERPGKKLTIENPLWKGTVSQVLRKEDGCTANAFVTDVALPQGDLLGGRWIILTFDTYAVIPSGTNYPCGLREQKGIRQAFQIQSVQRDRAGKTLIVLTDDPQLVIKDNQAIELARPHRTFSGLVGFEIALSKSE